MVEQLEPRFALAGAFPIQPFLLRGALAPDTEPNAKFSFLDFPVISQDGYIAFEGLSFGATRTHSGIWVGAHDDPSSLHLLAREGDAAPGAGDTYKEVSRFLGYTVTAGGVVAFPAELSGSDDTDQAIFAGKPASVQLVAREGQTAPGTGGTVFDNRDSFNPLGRPFLNQAAQVAYFASLRVNDDPLFPFKNSIFAGPAAATQLVARQGRGNVGDFGFISPPVGINASGQVAFEHASDEIWLGTPGGISKIVEDDTPAPGTTAEFSILDPFDLNNSGQVIFEAHIDRDSPPFPGFNENEGLWVAGPSTALVALEGSIAPGTSGKFGDPFNSTGAFEAAYIGGGGHVAFVAGLKHGGAVNDSNDIGLWTGTPGNIRLLARAGDPAPGTPTGVVFSGDFDNFGSINLNKQGAVAFFANVAGTGVSSKNDYGLWATDKDGKLQLVAREGDQIDIGAGAMRTLESVFMAGGTGGEDGRAAALNDAGQLVFEAEYREPFIGTFSALFITDITPEVEDDCMHTPGTGPAPAATITLEGIKYDDLNGNGTRDTGEPGLPGWTIQLDLDNNGTIDDSITTSSIGSYRFPALASAANVNISQKLGSQSETAIAVNPSNPNNLVAAANDSASIWGGPSRDSVWFSTDGGANWTLRDIPIPAGATVSRGDPTLVFDRTGQRVVYAHMVATSAGAKRALATAVSLDGGNTWPPALVGLISPFGSGDDRETLTVGPDYKDPTKDRFYATWHRNGVVYAASSSDGVIWDTNRDGTVNAADNVNVTGGFIGTAIAAIPAVGPDGEVFVVWEDYGTPGVGRVMLTRSTDGGLTWRPRRQVVASDVNTFRDPFNGGSEYVIPAQPNRGITVSQVIDVDRSNSPFRGRLYVVFTDQADRDGNPDANNPDDHHDTDVFVTTSDDCGAKWSAPVRINDTLLRSSQFFPWLTVDQTTGAVAVAWYDTRRDLGGGSGSDNDGLANTDAEVFASVSVDGGKTFSPNLQISDGTSNSYFNPSSNEYGDYMGMAFHAGVLHPIWTDNSDFTGQSPDGALANTDVYTARVRLIAAGSHRINEVLQEDYRQTGPSGGSGHVVTVSAGDRMSSLHFGNFELGSISGVKFLDLDRDGVRGASESVLSNWTIFLNPRDTDGDGVFDTGDEVTVTDADGRYEFRGLEPGMYRVGERLQAGMHQTTPSTMRTGVHIVTIEGVMSGEKKENRDFGNAPVQSLIVGQKFEDLNGDGVKQSAEPGVADWTVFIDVNGNGIFDGGPLEPSTRTDSRGNYAFANLPAGVYPIFEVPQAGWVETTTVSHAAGVDGTPSVFVGPTFGNFHLTTVTGFVVFRQEVNGSLVPRSDIGLLGKTVFADLNANGRLDASEPKAVSDASGRYVLQGLPRGRHIVRLQPDAGLLQVEPVTDGHIVSDNGVSGTVIRAVDFVTTPENRFDYGDAPAPKYSTLTADNGARHVVASELRLGAVVDIDANGNPDAVAGGDDADGTDDEDGVTFNSALIVGDMANITVTASAASKLDAWIDFNSDGDWSDAGEQIFIGRALAAGANALSFTVPVTAPSSEQTFARFRLSSTGGLDSFGSALDGEVEDYAVRVTVPGLIGTPGDDTLHVKLSTDGTTLEVYDRDPNAPGAMRIFTSPLNSTTPLSIDTLAGNDIITIDLPAGVNGPAGGLQLDTGSGNNELHIRNGRVALAPNAPRANILSALSLGAGATFDVSNNDLIIKSTAASKAAVLNALYGALRLGFAGGAWNGPGLISSAAQTNPDTTLSLVDNALLGYTQFSGQPVDGDSILLKHTYYGDIDHNGAVDADDLTVFANNFGRTSGATQVDGDIDFNGTIDADDLTVFANNFGRGIGMPLAAVSGGDQDISDEPLVDLLARAIAADAITHSSESMADPRLASSRRRSLDAVTLWADMRWNEPG